MISVWNDKLETVVGCTAPAQLYICTLLHICTFVVVCALVTSFRKTAIGVSSTIETANHISMPLKTKRLSHATATYACRFYPHASDCSPHVGRIHTDARDTHYCIGISVLFTNAIARCGMVAGFSVLLQHRADRRAAVGCGPPRRPSGPAAP